MKKLTKKYKFVGDSSGWGWDSNPVKGVTYDEDQLAVMYGRYWKARGGIELIINWNNAGWDDTDTYWEEITNELSVVDRLVELDGIFDKLLSCTSEIWDEIRNGDQVVKKEDQGEVIRLITLITEKYDKLNKEFNS